MRLGLAQREAHLEAGIAGLGIEADVSTVALHDPVDRIEPEAQPLAGLFCGEKRFKDVGLDFLGNARPGVADLNQQTVVLARRTDAKLAFSPHSCGCIIYEVSPNLVQLTAMGADAGQLPIVVADHGNSALQLVAEHHERTLDSVMDVDFRLRS